MGVTPGTRWRTTFLRSFVDDVYHWSRDTIARSGPTAGWHAGYTVENLARDIEDCEDRDANGWAPLPYAPSGAPTPIELLVQQRLDTGGGLDAFGEIRTTTVDGVDGTTVLDTTAVLSPGMKVRWGDGSGTWNYGVVTMTHLNGANVGVVWIVTPIGGQVPALGVLGPIVHVSPAAAPAGFPTDLAAWQLLIESPVDANGFPNPPAPNNVGVLVDATNWKSPSSAWALHIPGGPFELSFAVFLEGNRDNVGQITLAAGLSQVGSSQPPGDLDDRTGAGNTGFLRHHHHRNARRFLLNNNNVHTWALSVTDGGSTKTCLVRHDLSPVVVSARFLLNGS